MSPSLCLLSYRTCDLAPLEGFEPSRSGVEVRCSESIELQGHGATPAIVMVSGERIERPTVAV
jgi:hypothetical protein